MPGLWYKKVRGGKYLVKRRDGTPVEWPFIVLGAPDMAAPAGVRAYADKCEELGFDPEYVSDVRELAGVFEKWRKANRTGEPDGGVDRMDDPATVAQMQDMLGA